MKPTSKPSKPVKKPTPKGGEESSSPTMIIPRGTEIEVDPHGQLSIRAPGNLVIQNSGAYGHLESLGGSIRIDHNVEVEAVTVRCADTCFVQGSLTAWKVDAQALHVEETAQAQVVLQETDHLEIGREARVVGNFESEKELFLLFSRFAREVRSLPFYFERKGPAPEIGEGEGEDEEADVVEGDEADTEQPQPQAREEGAGDGGDGRALSPRVARATSAHGREDLPEDLFFALVLLERDAARQEYGPTSQRVLEEILKLLQERDLETLRHTWRTLFGRIIEPRQDVRRAEELIAAHYGNGDEEPSPPEPAEEDETQS